jgi:hypothetical protein
MANSNETQNEGLVILAPLNIEPVTTKFIMVLTMIDTKMVAM